MKKRSLLLRIAAILFAAILIVGVFTPDALASKKKKKTATPAVTATPSPTPAPTQAPEEEFVTFGESYSDKDHVAAYIHKFGELPPNYITKKEAQALGWVSYKGNLWKVKPGASIGGDYFGNYEGLLPSKKGRTWHECDIDFEGGTRNGKRILFSTDGLIYYTEDHYASYTQITFDD